MSERDIQTAILREFGSDRRLRLWRSNAGVGVVGDVALIMKICRRFGVPARLVRFGVPGQADLTGILPTGRRLEVECKTENGRQTADQANYEAMIGRMGGLYVLARSPEDVRAAIGEELE